MKKLYNDLWQIRCAIVFGMVRTHAYFLEYQDGNILFYNTGHEDEIQHMAELGGIKYQFLSHRDESGVLLNTINSHFNSLLGCHSKEEHIISSASPVDLTFSERITHTPGVEIIPTLGHTNGSLSFLYNSPFGLRYLFTGDTLFRSNGDWGTLIFPNAGDSTESLISSLLVYFELDPDVVISSAYSGDSPVTTVSKERWKADIKELIVHLKD